LAAGLRRVARRLRMWRAVGWLRIDRMIARALPRQHDLEATSAAIGDDPGRTDGGQHLRGHVVAYSALRGALARGVHIGELDVVAGAVVERELDRRVVAVRLEAGFIGAGRDASWLVVAVRAEQNVCGLSVGAEQQAKFGKAVRELHAIDVVAARSHAAKEDLLR